MSTTDNNFVMYRTPSLLLVVCVLATLLAACAPLPPQSPMAIRQVPSPNFDDRRPNLVVLHHTTDDTLDEALATLTSPERKVSAHYLVDRDGQIVQMVDERHRAWHAGKSWWGGITDINSTSIGIELDNNGYEPFADAQIDALLALLADIQQRHNIPAANFVGHADVAPARKVDPSELFPWKKLAEHGFGLWCDAPLPPAPPSFELMLTFTALGYDPATPDASQRAFRLHFLRSEETPSGEQENALAFCLLNKKSSGNRDNLAEP